MLHPDKSLTVGSLRLDLPCYQAALSGYSDYAMRQLNREFGAPLTFAGVMLDKVTLHPAVLRKPAFAVQDHEHPIGGQLLGTDPAMMAQAAAALAGIGYDVIDLNFACPAPKVLRRGRGGSLLQEPRQVLEIIRRVRDAVSCPLFIKLRCGFAAHEQEREDFWTICEQAVGAGVDALVVHGRTVKQRYRDRADWDIMKTLKQRLPTATIIGSGDIFKAEDVVRRLNETGLDGVLIARGAIGNPWIFSEIRGLLHEGKLPLPPTLTQQADVMLRHFELIRSLYPKRKGVAYFRKFLVHYTRRHCERRKFLVKLLGLTEPPDLIAAIKEWYGV